MEQLAIMQTGANIAFALTAIGVIVAVFCVLLDYRQKQDKEPGDLVCLGRDLFNVLAAGGTLAVTLQVIVWVQVIERRTEIIEERVLPVGEARAPDFGAVTDGIEGIQETLAAGEGRDDERFAELEERIRELVEPALAEPAPVDPVSLSDRIAELHADGRFATEPEPINTVDITAELYPILGPLNFNEPMRLEFAQLDQLRVLCAALNPDLEPAARERPILRRAGYYCIGFLRPG
ncbi:hypothetical protein DDZ18_13340 [Marinicauda salina]|uniref:Uncharacterized protein n=1 Tax=Marinicauda salina TaxID=2135793 RepID=A0A2U2BQW1_9PROT|nr:hypothetical protein [Marinicauda salina]PWE16400.1 hypothetical protein DDZ18_13340 [Marinicauda salina]